MGRWIEMNSFGDNNSVTIGNDYCEENSQELQTGAGLCQNRHNKISFYHLKGISGA
jgi:hypothetical protein